MRTVIYNYDKKSQGVYLRILSSIIYGCSNNPHFPDFPIAISVLSSKKEEYEKQLDIAKKGIHVEITKAKNIKKELNKMIKCNGIYINNTAQGNVAMLQSTGYELSKEKIYKQKKEIKTEHGDRPGSGKIIIRPVPDAVVYFIQIHPDPFPDPEFSFLWMPLEITTRSYQYYEGLEPLKLYWCRYCTVSTKCQSPWSEPFQFPVL